MEEQVENCSIKYFFNRHGKASCSQLHAPLILNEANTCCIHNFSNSENAVQAGSSCHSQNQTTSNIISWNRSSSAPVRDPSSKPLFDMLSPQLENCKVPPSGRNVVIIKSTSMPCQRQHDIDSEANQIDEEIPEEDEIPEEEAVCRICHDSLSEGGSWFKLQCSCKGDLRLVHQECASKWFGQKQNSVCEVCHNNVTNLPVTLIWVPNGDQSTIGNPSIIDRFCYDLIVLCLMSSICYFFFILQLLATRMKYNAILIAAPFSMTLGIVGSIISVNSARRGYAWAYAAFQFTCIVVFLHIFLSVLELHVALAMLVASFAGLGLAMGLNSLCFRIFAWGVGTIQARRNLNLA